MLVLGVAGCGTGTNTSSTGSKGSSKDVNDTGTG